MAKTIVFEVEVDEQGAVKSLNNIEKGVENIGEASDKTSKSVKGVGTSIGSIVKAAGIVGLLVKAFEFLVDALSQNQKFVDALQTATTALNIAFNDLFNFLSDNVGTVVDYFKSAFSDPKQAVIDLGEAVKNNLIERFNSLIESAGFLASAIKKLFQGDFSGALDDAKESAKEFADVLTGVDGTADALIAYTKETLNSADAITQATKASRLLELQQVRLREQYDRDAEQQRQIRDDVSRGIEERIEANRRLGEILEEQQKLEQETVQIRINNLRREQEALGPKQEIIEEIYALETELIAIEAQQAGFRSEQLTNENSLLKEKEDLLQSYRDAEEEYNAKAKEKRKKDADDDIKLAESVASAKEQSLLQGLNFAKNIAKEGSEFGKALAVSEAAASTFVGAQNAFTTAAASPITTAFPAYPFIQAAAAVAFGLGNIQNILSKKGENGAGIPSASAAAVAPPPTFVNNTPDAQLNQLGSTITEGINNRPVKAYVVANDVTTQQQLDRQTKNNTIL